MRDIVKDAAIIAVVKHLQNDNSAWMSVGTFVETYSGSKEAAQEEMRSTLAFYNLTKYEFVKRAWSNEGDYELIWNDDYEQ